MNIRFILDPLISLDTGVMSAVVEEIKWIDQRSDQGLWGWAQMPAVLANKPYGSLPSHKPKGMSPNDLRLQIPPTTSLLPAH
ncbi:unnamed protein product [Dovyalis caffra]|uniref:Uncharacterized protein n=1 Tax=Dovyalis caffra TaxID=77055 RepID=A0AAV1QPZ2_9ROSI|nr:unnamed protein product [Dovyalis caffra]